MKPVKLPAVGGHGAEMRLLAGGEVQAAPVKPMDMHLKRRFMAIGNFSSGILIEDKGYSVALHYRLAPHAERYIFDSVAAIRADLPEAPIEVLNGKFVVEIKHEGFSKATAVRALMKEPPFAGRRPIFLGDDVTDETVFAIMADIDGIAYSVGRKAQGVAGHFDSAARCARSGSRAWSKIRQNCRDNQAEISRYAFARQNLRESFAVCASFDCDPQKETGSRRVGPTSDLIRTRYHRGTILMNVGLSPGQ